MIPEAFTARQAVRVLRGRQRRLISALENSDVSLQEVEDLLRVMERGTLVDLNSAMKKVQGPTLKVGLAIAGLYTATDDANAALSPLTEAQ